MERKNKETNFLIWTPAEVIEKAGTPIDYKNMRMKGIASTSDMDMDDEVMLSGGLSVDYLLKKGFVNWHHQGKNSPATIIGEPEKAEITEKGLYVEAKLYDTPVAREVFDLARVLSKQSIKRKLGWSVEGRVLERSYDGTTIEKAILTGLALTFAPKNSNTFAQICKAFTDKETAQTLFEENEVGELPEELAFETKQGTYVMKGSNIKFFDKALAIGYSRGGERATGTVLGKESLEKDLKRLKNPELLRKIMNKFPAMKIEKAVKLYDKLLSNVVED
jgi:hypothetical protein